MDWIISYITVNHLIIGIGYASAAWNDSNKSQWGYIVRILAWPLSIGYGLYYFLKEKGQVGK